MCVVYNSWQYCSFPVLSVFIIYVCVCMEWLVQFPTSPEKDSDLVFLSSGEDLKGIIIQVVRIKEVEFLPPKCTFEHLKSFWIVIDIE